MEISEDDDRHTDLARYYKLRGKIRYFKRLYYVNNKTEIGDGQYDLLEKEFDALAEKLGLPGSWVGYDSTK